MMQMVTLLRGIALTEKVNANPVTDGQMVKNICANSRQVEKGSLFVAVKGSVTDGHKYISQAIMQGCTAIVCENLPEETPDHVLFLQVADSANALGIIAGNFYDNPSKKVNLVGITGTNGKTTCATLLFDLFTGLGYKCGLLSTVENRIGKHVVNSTHTTPDAVSLQQLLNEMVEEGCDYVFMEVSSHAIHQRRIAGLEFQGGVFTNVSHDHLDYHKTFKEYIYTKKRFFDELGANAFALVNIDDKRGSVMTQNSKAKVVSYGLKSMADFKAKILENNLSGLILEMDGKEFYSRLVGDFNAYNLLAVYGTAILLNQNNDEVLQALSSLQSVNGRFDYLYAKERQILAIVDYAHTPDALEKVLVTIDKLRKGNEQVITVVGCGGDRDRSKRPVMAKAACDYSNKVILTSDNPRTENPETILREMEEGIPPYATTKVITISDRRQAIKTASMMAQVGDIILVAGKGHENYQEIQGVKHPFDDKKILQEFLLD